MSLELQQELELLTKQPAQPPQVGTTETYSDNILGPVSFKMYDLKVAGTSKLPAAPANSPYIIAADETFYISVKIKFNKTPLTALLMCLGTQIVVDFAAEGYGSIASEPDLIAPTVITQENEYEYTIVFKGVPKELGMKSGLYSIAAIADIGPVVNKCKTCVFGHGYLDRVLLEVYPSGEECYGPTSA
ncbi:hypothetical protein K9N68_18235 [Kovacikia minuta CCNUW1]|uniref:hypothetical protein n=1 Tax=Kovacikia minuta TaxID=2931930 RepID=UPI001CCC171B|nr:hypothetical protein [Kovacikia minuta]UBF23709.1 hypothetical protein K9N68_18235 [Kovacikia minuta CCNUW1]